MDESSVWLLTEQGIYLETGEPLVGPPFSGKPVVAGTSAHGNTAVVVGSGEVWELKSEGWVQLCETDVTLNCIIRTNSGKLLVGTAGARVAETTENGLRFLPPFDVVPERSQWDTPWGRPPDVRSFAVSSDGSIYANVHVGWIVRSLDDGQTWKCLTNGLEKDVHQVATMPHAAQTVFAATARGFFLSIDGGENFRRLTDPMPYYYQRACAAFSGTDTYLSSTSRGPHGQADSLLFRSTDCGVSWEKVDGLPDGIAQNLDTHQLITQKNGTAWIVVENSKLWRSFDFGASWEEATVNLPKVSALLTVAD